MAVKLAYLGFLLAILNFAAFAIIALNIGGDAVNGKREGGRYYLCNHGAYTEVSRPTIFYSKTHAYSVWATHALAGIAGLTIVGRRHLARSGAKSS